MITTYELRTENNPSREKNETAIYFGSTHCGYGKTTLEADKIAQEIKAAREAAAAETIENLPACERCGDTGQVVIAGGINHQGKGVWQYGDCPDCQPAEAAAAQPTEIKDLPRNLLTAAAHMIGAEYASALAELEAATPAPVQPARTPRRRKAAKPCTCPLCQANPAADGVYRCKTGQEFIAYHAGIYVAAGEFLAVDEALKNHRYTLLNRPLPDATSEEVADVLAAAKLAA